MENCVYVGISLCRVGYTIWLSLSFASMPVVYRCTILHNEIYAMDFILVPNERTNERVWTDERRERHISFDDYVRFLFYFLFCSLSLALKTLCKVRKLLIEWSAYTHRGTQMQKVKSNDSKSSKACCLCHTERKIYTVYCKVK